MNTNQVLPTFTLITGPHHYARHSMQQQLIEAALHEPVRVLLGGNYFPVYEIAYAFAAQKGDYYTILNEHLSLSRAETCYQMTALLKDTPGAAITTFVSDLLTPFMDEGIRDKEAGQLLFESINELRRLSRQTQVVVSASHSPNRPYLLLALSRAASTVHTPPPESPAPRLQKGWL